MRMRVQKICIYLQNMRKICIYSQNCTYLYIIGLCLCIISYYITIILQINGNFMQLFIIRMRMQNFVSMHILHSSKKCYEILHILATIISPGAGCKNVWSCSRNQFSKNQKWTWSRMFELRIHTLQLPWRDPANALNDHQQEDVVPSIDETSFIHLLWSVFQSSLHNYKLQFIKDSNILSRRTLQKRAGTLDQIWRTE